MKILVAMRDFLKNLSCCQSSCMNQTTNQNNIEQEQEIQDLGKQLKEIQNMMNLLLARSQHSLIRPNAS